MIMKVEHECRAKGQMITLLYPEGLKCPLCGKVVEETSDDYYRDILRDIDSEDIEISEWETKFIENLLYQYKGRLSQRQKQVIQKMGEKYGKS